MKHISDTFKDIRNRDIHYEGWLPDGKTRAVLFIVHGLGEHIGRYQKVAEYFTPLGFALYGIDLIGHGKSDGGREVVERFSDFTAPLRTFFKMVAAWQPDKPIFLYGHSLGGLIGVEYLLENQGDFKGAIISAPLLLVPSNISPITLAMANVLSTLAPNMGVTDLYVKGLSRDPEVVNAYMNDPLVFHGKTPARVGAELLKTMRSAMGRLNHISLPFLVVQGDADVIVNPGGAQLIYDRAGSADKSIKIYRGFFHEVHNEPERLQVLWDIETWLEGHI